MSDSLDNNFGSCCICGCENESVRNFMMLNKKAPIQDTGWGCTACNLPFNGAVAVICDDCLETEPSESDVVYAINGYPVDKQRISVLLLTEDFHHIAHDDDVVNSDGFNGEEEFLIFI